MIENFYTNESETEEPQPAHHPFTPIGDILLVQRVELDNGKIGSFIRPDQFRIKSNTGIVISIGDKVLTANPGDKVTFGEFNTEDIQIDGEPFLLVRISDVRGVEKAL